MNTLTGGNVPSSSSSGGGGSGKGRGRSRERDGRREESRGMKA